MSRVDALCRSQWIVSANGNDTMLRCIRLPSLVVDATWLEHWTFLLCKLLFNNIKVGAAILKYFIFLQFEDSSYLSKSWNCKFFSLLLGAFICSVGVATIAKKIQ